MKQRGFTLLELMITMVLLAIVVAIAAPNFSQLVQDNRATAAAMELLSAVKLARTSAVSRNSRVTLRHKGKWELGWIAFADTNNNGIKDAGEQLIFSGQGLESATLQPNQPLANYISFIGTGASRYVTGGLQMGTIVVCTSDGTPKYDLILSAGGRMRIQNSDHPGCE